MTLRPVILPANEVTDGGACLFSSAAWLDALSGAFQFDTRVAVWPDGQLPFVVRDDIIGRRIVILPFSDYVTPSFPADVLTERLLSLQKLFPEFRLQARLPCELPVVDHLADWTCDQSGVIHEVELGDVAHMQAKLAQNFRWGVNKASRDGVKVSFQTDRAAAHRFFSLFARHRRRKFSILSHPRVFFEAITDNFMRHGRGWFAEAHLDGRLIASILLLADRDRIYYKFGASELDDALRAQPYNALLWEAMQRFAAAYRWLDLGMSWTDARTSPGVLKFKESLGAGSRPVTILSATPETYNEARDAEARQALRGVTTLLTRHELSDDDTDDAGRQFFRYFI